LRYTGDEPAFLSATQPNRTLSVNAKVRTPPMDDASNAWLGDAVGFRLLLDDGQRHAELLFAGDPFTRGRLLKFNSGSRS
jgi:hypothetical protein